MSSVSRIAWGWAAWACACGLIACSTTGLPIGATEQADDAGQTRQISDDAATSPEPDASGEHASDECGNRCGDSASCSVRDGHFACECKPGLVLASDSVSCKQPTWGTPVMLNKDMLAFLNSADIAGNARGDVVVAFSQATDHQTVWTKRFVPGQGWGPNVVLQQPDVHGGGGLVKVVIGADGDGLVVWNEVIGHHNVTRGSRLSASHGFGAAMNASNDNSTDNLLADLTMTPNGDARVLWLQPKADGHNVWQNTLPKSGTWGIETALDSMPGMGPERFRLASNAAGQALAAWEQTVANTVRVEIVAFDGMSWGAETDVSERKMGIDTHAAALALNDAGQGLVAWDEDHPGSEPDVHAAHFTSTGGFEQDVLISAPGGHGSDPRVALDAMGRGLIVWNDVGDSETRVRANALDNDGHWSESELIDLAPSELGSVSVLAMNASGVAIVAGVIGGEDGSHAMWANSYVPDSGWSTAIALGPTTQNAYPLGLVIDEQGRGTLLYSVTIPNAPPELWATRFE